VVERRSAGAIAFFDLKNDRRGMIVKHAEIAHRTMLVQK